MRTVRRGAGGRIEDEDTISRMPGFPASGELSGASGGQPDSPPLRQADRLSLGRAAPAPAVGAGAFVAPSVQCAQLAPQLRVTRHALVRQATVRDGGDDGAAGLTRVPAVTEAALGRERRDVLERALDGYVVRPELHLAEARRVDEQSAAGEQDELALGRGVPSAVVSAERSRREVPASEQPVRER